MPFHAWDLFSFILALTICISKKVREKEKLFNASKGIMFNTFFCSPHSATLNILEISEINKYSIFSSSCTPIIHTLHQL